MVLLLVPFLFIISVYVRLYQTSRCNSRHKLDLSDVTTFGISTIGKVGSLKHCAACGAPRYTRLNSAVTDNLSHCKTCNSPKDLIQAAANTRLAILVRKETRAAIMTGSVFVLFLVFMLPLLTLLWVNCIVYNVITPTAINVAFWLSYSNSACTPIMYIVTNPDFRKAFQHTFCYDKPS
jgi:hypothetical protein